NFSNTVEEIFGTSINDPNFTPSGSAHALDSSMIARYLAGASWNFRSTPNVRSVPVIIGKYTLKANLTVPEGFTADDKQAVVQLGAAAMLFNFDPKGKGTGKTAKSTA